MNMYFFTGLLAGERHIKLKYIAFLSAIFCFPWIIHKTTGYAADFAWLYRISVFILFSYLISLFLNRRDIYRKIFSYAKTFASETIYFTNVDYYKLDNIDGTDIREIWDDSVETIKKSDFYSERQRQILLLMLYHIDILRNINIYDQDMNELFMASDIQKVHRNNTKLSFSIMAIQTKIKLIIIFSVFIGAIFGSFIVKYLP